jgi:high-affinity Fe2+/Pb2+ permease
MLGGLALLGFSCVYREGFEVVLFLQNLRLKYGAGIVARGAALGIALTLAVGVVSASRASCRTSGCSSRPACCSAWCSS